MKLQVLVSSVNQEIMTLADRMHLQTDAIIVNQTDHFGYEEYMHNGRRIQCYEFQEKGVGLSRNNALLRAEGDIVLFSDEDIVYDTGYERRILDAFAAHPEADLLLFNMRVGASRATYHTEAFHRVHIWNAGALSHVLLCGAAGEAACIAYYFFIAVWRRREVQQRGGQSFSEGLSEIRIGGLCSTN